MAFFRCGGGGSEGNAVAADVLSGKTFSNDDDVGLTGSMTNNGAVSQTLNTSTTSYTVPQGYHNGSGTVSITTQTKSCTPSTSAQTISPDSGKVLSSVSVSAIQTQEKTVTAGTSAASVTPDSGKYLSKVTYNPTPSQTKTVTSSRSAQTVTPDSGKLLSKVTVNALAPTGTYTPTSRAANIDMGSTSNYRYVTTTSVPNSNSGTYTPTSNGSALDMGATNTYRYVNTNTVYNLGKSNASNDTIHLKSYTVSNSDGCSALVIVNRDSLKGSNVRIANLSNVSAVSIQNDTGSTTYLRLTSSNLSGTLPTTTSSKIRLNMGTNALSAGGTADVDVYFS